MTVDWLQMYMTRQIRRPNATHEQPQWAKIHGHWQTVPDIDNPFLKNTVLALCVEFVLYSL